VPPQTAGEGGKTPDRARRPSCAGRRTAYARCAARSSSPFEVSE